MREGRAAVTTMVTVRVPAALGSLTGGRPEIRVPAETIGAALAAVIESYPAMRRHLYGEDGRIRGFVNIYRNGDDVRWTGAASPRVADGDVITIVPSIAGG